MKKYLITSALPYVNGIKHLGNLIGSLLPADVYTRYLRQHGHQAIYICGTDEHGAPAELAAQEQQETVEEFCALMHLKQKTIYQNFNIEFDYFGRSSSSYNHQLTQQIFQRLEAAGYIEEREIQQIYSLEDERFLPDRYVIGSCPYCSYTQAKGDQCDSCGKLLDPIELINPYSAINGSHNLELRSSKHLFFRLSRCTTQLQQWIEAHPHWSALTSGTAHKWLREGLQDRCITRDLAWGVTVPKVGYENKVFYVWFDAPIAYISITQEWLAQLAATQQSSTDTTDWQHWWYGSQTAEVEYVQFMAKDNLPFHTIFWPAMMLATGEPWKLADQIKGFNWLTYAGGKFSTSQKRGVFTDQALALFPADYWRYYLLATAPEGSDADFTFAHFATIINKDLADILGNFVNRVLALIAKYFAGHIPNYDLLYPQQLAARCQLEIDQLNSALAQLKFRLATQHLRALWVIGNEYITVSEPWRQVKEQPALAATSLVHCLHLIRLFAILSFPFMPTTAAKLLQIFGESTELLKRQPATLLDFSILPVGRQLIIPSERLFEKITEEMVHRLTAQFTGPINIE